jgi:hypothetical protein
MTKIKGLISKERSQYLVYIGLSFGVVVLTGILYFSDNPFQRFIGGINPLIASFFIILLGFISLSFLLSRGWFAIYKKENLRGLFRRSILAVPFALITILVVDLNVPFPADLNVLFPESLLFYPAIGFFVEILFHVLPLSIFLLSLTSIFKNANHKNIIWISIIIVSLLEPVFQTMPLFSSSHYPLWAATIVLLNLFLFNLSQLYIFKRYDFISMYSFRLVYYLIWHIVWGNIRILYFGYA